MQLEMISITDLAPAGDMISCLDSKNLAPLIVCYHDKEYHLIPGQDDRLSYMKSIGINNHPAYLLPGTTSADCLVAIRDMIRELGRGGLIEFALHLIPFLESEGIKITKVTAELWKEWGFDERGSNKLKLTTDTDDIFHLIWQNDGGGMEGADLLGMAEYILYSHPEHPIVSKIKGAEDIFWAIDIRNDFSGMFWDLKADWNRKLDEREAREKLLEQV